MKALSALVIHLVVTSAAIKVDVDPTAPPLDANFAARAWLIVLELRNHVHNEIGIER